MILERTFWPACRRSGEAARRCAGFSHVDLKNSWGIQKDQEASAVLVWDWRGRCDVA